MPPVLRAPADLLLKFVDDLLVAVLYNKDIVKQHRGETIDGERKKDRFHAGIEPVMFDEM